MTDNEKLVNANIVALTTWYCLAIHLTSEPSNLFGELPLRFQICGNQKDHRVGHSL